MSERFHVFADGVQVHASHGEPKRITVLDGELTSLKVREDGAINITEPALLVADRAFVQLESLQPGSVKPESAPKPRRAPEKPKSVKAPAKRSKAKK